MIVRTAEQVRGTPSEARGADWASLRMLVRDDGVGFTVTDTTVEPGLDLVLHYKHHVEACYCIEGAVTVEDLTTGEVHRIRPGTLYALDQHDRHRIRAETRARLICVFTPALSGDETHDADGSYGAS